jgi:hypothetical protein
VQPSLLPFFSEVLYLVVPAIEEPVVDREAAGDLAVLFRDHTEHLRLCDGVCLTQMIESLFCLLNARNQPIEP